MLLFRVTYGAVEEGYVDVFVREGFNVFVFDVDGYRPENYVGEFYYVKIFSFKSKTAISQPPQLAAQ